MEKIALKRGLKTGKGLFKELPATADNNDTNGNLTNLTASSVPQTLGDMPMNVRV